MVDMHMTLRGRQRLTDREGKMLVAYQDTKKIWTIGEAPSMFFRALTCRPSWCISRTRWRLHALPFGPALFSWLFRSQILYCGVSRQDGSADLTHEIFGACRQHFPDVFPQTNARDYNREGCRRNGECAPRQEMDHWLEHRLRGEPLGHFLGQRLDAHNQMKLPPFPSKASTPPGYGHRSWAKSAQLALSALFYRIQSDLGAVSFPYSMCVHANCPEGSF
jgi:hypothetical protein